MGHGTRYVFRKVLCLAESPLVVATNRDPTGCDVMVVAKMFQGY